MHIITQYIFIILFLANFINADAQCRDTLIEKENVINKTSLFDFIYQMEGRPKIEIETNYKKLIRDKLKETYQETDFRLFDSKGKVQLNLSGKVRARGNTRKKVCYLPPLKIDFKKSDLDTLGFLKLDNLKLVLPADRMQYNQEKLYKEFFIYQLYHQLDSSYIRTKLVDISIRFKGKTKYQLTGFLIEDEEEYARRNEAKVIETGVLIPSAADQESFAKVVFFQYMIANTDYSIPKRHNIEMVKLPNRAQAVVLPYDFDYSGFVNNKYAIPNPMLPIRSVRQRYFFPGYKMDSALYQNTRAFFLSKKEDVLNFCSEATYMKPKTRASNKHFLRQFFTSLEHPNELKKKMVR